MATNTGTPFSFDVPEGTDLATFVATFLAPALTNLNSNAVHKTAAQTLTTKTLTAPTINAGTLTALTGFALRDTSGAFDVTIAAVSSAAISAGRTLTLDVGNVAHTLALGTTANTITFPNAASGTVPLLNLAQTWTALQSFGTNLGGTLQTAAQPNVTSLGTLAANLLFTDATYDIGASGATRPRSLFLSGAATIGGLLTTVATATGSAGLVLPHGTAPTSPVNGDVWTTTAGIYARINGATVGPLSAGGATVRQMLGGSHINAMSNGTAYFPLVNFTNAGVASEGAVSVPIPFSAGCIVARFYVKTNTAQPADGSLVFTLFKNGSATAMAATVAANAAAGQFTDVANPITYAAGDTISVRVVNNASGSSATFTWMFEFDPS